jgi:2'-5' RNA ligase
MLIIQSHLIKEAYSFSSTQVDLSTSIAKEIIEWGKRNIPDKELYFNPEEKNRFGREKEIHCTVKYGLHTLDSRKVNNIVKGFKPFTLTLGEVSRFVPSDEPYDVVKIEVQSEKLHELHDLLSELDNSDKHANYRPHVTVAYVRAGTSRHLSGNTVFVGRSMRVNEITFCPKEGEQVKCFLAKI